MIRRFFKTATLAIPLLTLQVSAHAATCSCAGVPLLTYLDTSALEKGQLFISYTAEDHQISDLVSGKDDVPDETGRDRNSFSQVLSASYAITDHWSVSALTSYVKHSRTINASFLGETTSRGFGDSVVLARYTPIAITPFSRHQFSLGAGVRLPTGEDDYGDGFPLSEDMQPSVGAFGTILWTSYNYAFNQAATMQLYSYANYTWNEENDREYAFGDEFYFALGWSQNLGTRFGYSAGLRYRSTRVDRRFGFPLPNTGGEWLDFIPAVNYSVTDSFNIALSGRIPLARNLNGALQFTTSYSYALSMTYGF